jgi:(2Fe-2S) ferredoxin
MSTTMNLAIETYANLTNQTAERIIELSLSGDNVVNENIMKLMFSVS